MLLAVGRLEEPRGYGLLLDAAAHWADHKPRPLLVVAGEGPQRAALERRIEAERLPVLLLGRRADVPELLSAADLVVLPSRWEARSLVAQEALYAGVPLVATEVGGTPELVGEAAVLVPYGDAAGFGRAVTELLADPERRTALAVAGRAQAATWPTEDDTVAQVLSIYDELTRPEVAPGGFAVPVRSRPPTGEWLSAGFLASSATAGGGAARQATTAVRSGDPSAGAGYERKAPQAVRRKAVSMSGTWLNACGKLPTWRCRRGSHSSASSPRSLRSASSFSNSRRASSTRPIIARSSASQNEQARKAPSSPGSPSRFSSPLASPREIG